MSFKQIQAAQQIMKIALNSQNHVDSLIGYYRDSIDKFNNQRMQWAQYYQACKDNVSNKHLLQRQINSLTSKRIDLQTNLTALKGELTYQRQKYFQRIQKSQKIKQNLSQNIKRLQQLTQICKPLNIQNSGVKSVYSIKTGYQSNKKPHAKFTNQRLNEQSPNEILELQLINQTKQHQQKKRQIQKVIDLLKDQLDELVCQHGQRGNQCSKEYQQALSKVNDLQNKHVHLVVEYFRYRTQNLQQEQHIQQQNQIIRLKNVALAQKLKLLEQSHSKEFKTIQNQVKAKNKQFKLKYDQQLLKKQQHVSMLKQQHKLISEIYLNKLKKLQSQLILTSQKSKSIQQKTTVQVSSLKSQIKILTNRLQNVAMNQMRSDLVNNQESQDDSSVTIEMEELDRINHEVKGLERQLQNQHN